MGRYASFAASLVVLFWSGSLVFGYPGVIAPYWREELKVGSGEMGNVMFFILAAVGIFMFFVGRWQERYGFRLMVLLGVLISSLSFIPVSFPGSIYLIYLWAFINGIQSCNNDLLPVCCRNVPGIHPHAGVSRLCGHECSSCSTDFSHRSHRSSKNQFSGFGRQKRNESTLSIPLGIAKGLAPASAVLVLTAFNLTNGFSRLISGIISDHHGRNRIMSLSWGSSLPGELE